MNQKRINQIDRLVWKRVCVKLAIIKMCAPHSLCMRYIVCEPVC